MTKKLRLELLIGIVGLITAIISLATAAFSLVKAIGNEKGISDMRMANLENMLGGERNWFVYPDENRMAVGVFRLPIDFRIRSPIKHISANNTVYGPNERIDGDCGAHVELEIPWKSRDIPLWQRDAYRNWKNAETNNPMLKQELREWLNHKFQNHWKKHDVFNWGAVVDTLIDSLVIEYPITSVDVFKSKSSGKCFKHGVGMLPVYTKQKIVVWLAGDIQDESGKE